MDPPAGASSVDPPSTATPESPPAAPATLPPDAEIRRILAERVGDARDRYGIVVGVVDASGRRVVSYGSRTHGDARPLDGDTLFEIGSISKVFTGLLLAEAVERHELSLSDSVAKCLPASVKLPERNGRVITLLDLATHSSGLPRLPSNLAPKDPENPYADYSVDQLYQFLATVELTHDVGTHYEYSNVGAGLLGHALALRAGQSYEALVRSRVLDPLDMASTRITLSPELEARLAPGHGRALERTANWDVPTLAGAGALRSTANDLLTFLAAALDLVSSPLTRAQHLAATAQRPTDDAGTSIGLGWHITNSHGKGIVWHNGGTGGYRTFIGYDPAGRAGVAVLANVSTDSGPDDIGLHLLDAEFPLATPGAPGTTPGKLHTEMKIDPRLLDGYVGRYQLTASAVFEVTRRGDQLYAKLASQPAFPVYPEADKEFFYKVVDAQLTFQTDDKGKATALVLHQNGRHQLAPRVEGASVVRPSIALSPAVFDRYVGRYQLTPKHVLSITRAGQQFFVQLTGQPALEILASSERDFFVKDVDAQLSFEVSADGKVKAVTLHQNGDQRAPRIE